MNTEAESSALGSPSTWQCSPWVSGAWWRVGAAGEKAGGVTARHGSSVRGTDWSSRGSSQRRGAQGTLVLCLTSSSKLDINWNTSSLCRPLQVTKCQCLDTAAVSWWSLRWAYLPVSEKPMSLQFWKPQPLAHFRLMNDHTRERTSKPVVAFLMETPLHKKLAY